MNILRKTVSNFVYQGQRKYMEDRYVIIKDKDFEIYGVCDGHGGEDVSNFVMGVLPKILYNKIKQKLVNLNLEVSLERKKQVEFWQMHLTSDLKILQIQM